MVGFVQRQAPRLHPKRSKLLTTALRFFLRYARYRGEVTVDLAAAVPVVPNWSKTGIPRAITSEQVRQLLASINQGTAIGRRDYAILLVLARLGLRSSEVVFLDLDDIDWNVGQLSVRGKRGQRTTAKRMGEAKFPLYAANLRGPDGAPLPNFKDRSVVTVDGVRIGLTGATYDDSSRASSAGDLKFSSTPATTKAQADAYSCVRKPRSAVSGVLPALDRSCAIRCSAPVSMRPRTERISFVMD